MPGVGFDDQGYVHVFIDNSTSEVSVKRVLTAVRIRELDDRRTLERLVRDREKEVQYISMRNEARSMGYLNKLCSSRLEMYETTIEVWLQI